MTKKGRATPSRIDRSKILLAARRFYDHGHTQAQIAKDLGISASYLAKLLRRAREEGWIRIYVDSAREVELAAAIIDKYPHLKHVEVVPAGSTPADTATAIATTMAYWFDDLLDRDEEEREPKIQRIAIGAAWPHRLMVEQLKQRIDRASVAPTSLANAPSARQSAQTPAVVAALLAHRLGAIRASGSPGSQCLYDLRLDPPGDLGELASWWARIRASESYDDLAAFWTSTDVQFYSAVGLDHAWQSTIDVLAALGTSLADLRDRGAVAWCGGAPVDVNGRLVAISSEVPWIFAHRAIGNSRSPATGRTVLDLWGSLSIDAVPLLECETVTHLFCCLDAARAITHS